MTLHITEKGATYYNSPAVGEFWGCAAAFTLDPTPRNYLRAIEACGRAIAELIYDSALTTWLWQNRDEIKAAWQMLEPGRWP